MYLLRRKKPLKLLGDSKTDKSLLSRRDLERLKNLDFSITVEMTGSYRIMATLGMSRSNLFSFRIVLYEENVSDLSITNGGDIENNR